LTTRLTHLTQALAVCALATAALCAAAQSRTDIHRDAATRNSGGDPFMLNYARAFYCNLADDNNQIVVASRGWNNTTGTGANAQYRIPATQIFDDVWFVGNHYVGQYLIKTSDGFVQVDGANTADEVQTFNLPAMQALGLGPTYPLKAVLLTHGHRDHDGGASWLKSNLNPEIFLGSADAANKAYAPTPIDSTNLAMREMSIGGKTFWILPTPGHTVGSTSAVVEVKDHGRPVRVLINGGQSMTNQIPAVVSYLDSIERTYAMVKALNVEGVMTPHIYWDGEGEKMREILATGRTNPSQHVYGHASVVRQMVVARECSAAWLSRLDATAVLPVWRLNAVEFLHASPTPGRLAAKVSNGWGPLANQPVTFQHEASGASCQATTNASGVAACSPGFGPLQPGVDKVKVSFAGASTNDFVDLPAETTATVGNGCSDLARARAAMGSRAGQPRYVPRLDVDGNGLIDVRDVAAISRLMAAGTVCK
jgi:glyoxylase-like metal-dependent hydrolase (beta-lactamase superfamily II)